MGIGLEIRNKSGVQFMTPDSTMCRVIDKIWMCYGLEPVCMSNDYAFELYHGDTEKFKLLRSTAIQNWLTAQGSATPPGGITDEYYNSLSVEDKAVVREYQRREYVDITVPYNQLGMGRMVFRDVLTANETLWVAVIGNRLKAHVVDFDRKALQYYFEIPDADSPTTGYTPDKHRMDFDGGSQSSKQNFIKSPYWGYLVIGAK
jgi:hypothetical protein